MNKSDAYYKILYEILHLANQNLPFNELLEQVFEVVISSPEFPFETKGCIFLTDPHSHKLILQTQRRLTPELHEKCSEVDFGECLCGQAAVTQQIVFKNHLDDQHSISYDQIKPHGHYCVPIVAKKKCLGVLNVYVKPGHNKNLDEQNFLIAVADTLATIIENHQAIKSKEEMRSELIQSAKMATLGTLSASIAHELNNPLTVIIGYARMLKSYKGDEKVAKVATGIEKSSLQMKKTADHLRKFARKSKKQDQQIVNIAEVILDSIDILDRKIKQLGIEIKFTKKEKPIFMWGDPIQLESVFQNLLSNSCDSFFEINDQRTCKIELHLSTTTNSLQIKYKDNAGGMSPETKKKLFLPFFTTKSMGEGTGLGMSISQKIITSHKGTIRVESELKKGTEFNLVFPLYFPENPKILILEDESITAELYKNILEQLTCTTLVTDNSSDGLSLAKTEKPDLILLDYQLVDSTGLEFLKKIKEQNPHTPVFVITGYYDKDLSDQFISAGAEEVYPKPLPPPKLIDIVIKVFPNLDNPDPSTKHHLPLPDLKGKKVLLADDESGVCILFSDILNDQGLNVKTVNSAHEAVECLSKEHYDLFIVDYQMPLNNGIWAAEEAKSLNPNIPIIMITGLVSHSDLENIEQRGVRQLLHKPIHPDDLIEAVAESLITPS